MKDGVLTEIFGVGFLGFGGYILYVLLKGVNDGINDIGFIGEGLYSGLFMVLGVLSYLLPFIFFMYAFVFIMKRKFKVNRIKLLSFFILFVLIASFLVIASLNIDGKTLAEVKYRILEIGGNGKSGGMLGAVVALSLFVLFGRTGALIIVTTLILINFFIFMNRQIKDVLGRIFKRLKKSSTKDNVRNEIKDKKFEIKKEIKKVEKKVDENRIIKIKKDKKQDEVKTVEKIEEEKKTKKIEDSLIDIPLEKNFKEEKIIEDIEEEDFDQEYDDDIIDFGDEKNKVEKTFEEKTKEFIDHEKNEKEKSFSEIFRKKEKDQGLTDKIKEQIEEKMERLEEVLGEYGIEAKVRDYVRGPVLTRFELAVQRGVRVKKVVALSDDLAMNLEAKSIRIEAPIPGKNAIGIEIPNETTEDVYFSELLNSKYYEKERSALSIILGKDIEGNDSIVDLKKMPHLLIAGRTGSGKSVCINSLISSIITKTSEEEVRFILIDPKMVELMPYNEIPHLLVPVIIDPKIAAIALKWAVNEMEERYRLLAKVGVRNLEGYNVLDGVEKLPYIVVVIDELADLMMVAPGSIEESIARIAQKARAIGIHLVVATQRPSIDVITGTIKANLPSRISFAVASQIDSRTILDTPGAEKLLGRGDMLFLESGSPNLIRIQGAYISDDEVTKLTKFLKKKAKPNYNQTVLEDPEDSATDELYEKAIKVIQTAGKVSTSLIQRKLKVGYSRAARIMDQLEENGVVNSDREILIDG